jgi:hypothetical protein
MSCLLCGSSNEAELTAEMVIHFSGLKNLDKLLVCLNCGCSRFTVPQGKLASIAHTREIGSLTLESSADDVTLSSGVASQVGR